MATKIASRKKKMPSIAKRTPNTFPKRPVNSGHSRPNSNESTVPVTAPTANVTATTWDQRRASSSASSSLRRSPCQLAISMSAGNATPSEARTIWNPSVNAIWLRAASSVVAMGSGGAQDLGPGLGRAEPVQQVVADAQRVGHRRQGRVHRPDAREEARIDDV